MGTPPGDPLGFPPWGPPFGDPAWGTTLGVPPFWEPSGFPPFGDHRSAFSWGTAVVGQHLGAPLLESLLCDDPRGTLLRGSLSGNSHRCTQLGGPTSEDSPWVISTGCRRQGSRVWRYSLGYTLRGTPLGDLRRGTHVAVLTSSDPNVRDSHPGHPLGDSFGDPPLGLPLVASALEPPLGNSLFDPLAPPPRSGVGGSVDGGNGGDCVC